MKSAPIVRFPDKKEQEVKFIETIEIEARRNDIIQNLDITQRENRAIVDLSEEDRPILIWALSDAHLFSKYTKNDLFKRYFDMVMNADGAFICSLGDMIDSGVRHKSLTFEDTLAPSEQYQLLAGFLQLCGDKLLWVVSGNHELFAQDAGDDPAYVYMHNTNAPYFRAVGHIRLRVGSQEYKGLVAHKGLNFSQMNYNHENIRLMAAFNPTADFVMSADRHVSEALNRYIYDGEYKQRVAMFKTGTFKLISDVYGRSNGFKDADPSTTCGIFFPDRRTVLPFLHLEDGLEVLSALRHSKYANSSIKSLGGEINGNATKSRKR